MKGFLEWLMRSRTARVGAAALFGLVRLFGPVSGGAIALVTLRLGVLEGIVTALAASLVLGAIEVALVHGGLFVLTLPTLILWWIVIALAWVLKRTASLALTVQAATALGCLGVVLFFVANPNPVEFWTPVLVELFKPLLEHSSLTRAQWPDAVSHVAMIATGVMGASLVLGSSLAVFCGRWGQALLYNPGGFKSAFHKLRMGWAATLAASVIFVLAGVFNNVVVDNLAIVLLVMFMFQGLAVLHNVVGKKRLHVGWLVAFYVVFAFEFLYVLAVVAGAGLIDNWFDIRMRVARR